MRTDIDKCDRRPAGAVWSAMVFPLAAAAAIVLQLFCFVPTAAQGPGRQAIRGSCDCDDLEALIKRKYEVTAALSALARERSIAEAEDTTPGHPIPYVDSRDAHLLGSDLQNAMNAVRDGGNAEILDVTSACPTVHTGPNPPCLQAAAARRDAVFREYCEARHNGFEDLAGLLGNPDWRERTQLSLLLDHVYLAYQEELVYINRQISYLQNEMKCKTTGWTGEVTVTRHEKHNLEFKNPGTIQGSTTVEEHDIRTATIVVVNSKPVGNVVKGSMGELVYGYIHLEKRTSSGQTQCGGGKLKPELTPFSSTVTSTLERKGTFYSHPSFALTFDPQGFKIDLSIKGGYGTQSQTYKEEYTGKCPPNTELAPDSFDPRVFLDGFTAHGRGRGKKTDLALVGSEKHQETGGAVEITIEWNLSRSGGR